ncbi:MAG TPA: malto-oligosyltrehalose synthase [Mycobacteriales bacterium]|nr:malto-oligosyltrehalose synthase [Mycobacteriales bacterium]
MIGRGLGATYRLQLNGLGFAAAADLVPLLHDLGVEVCYVSPVTRARAGSTHGYDVVDPTVLDPALGTEAEFEALLRELAAHEMRLLVDIVPNHLAASTENPWFADVLRHGRDSAYAAVFDIDWPQHGGKLLLPVLGQPLPDVLAAGEIAIDEAAVAARYFDHAFPLDPQHPPSPGEEVAAVLHRQHYQLAEWRVANQQLNYRRFFDINDLIGVRQEDPAVFAQMHSLVLRLASDDGVAGLRVDHVDGLRDPGSYLEQLRTAVGERPAIVVEKVLERDERLPGWPVDGTTGYEFAADAIGLFVDPAGADQVARTIATATGDGRSFEERAVAAKRAALTALFPHQLDEVVYAFAAAISEPVDHSALSAAVLELTARLPVYRTYRRAEEPMSAADRRWVGRAVRAARGSLPSAAERALAAVAAVITGPLPADGTAWLAVADWQQLSSPATAKGVEDTALYDAGRPLAAADVGADPDRPAVEPPEFHARMRDRQRRASRALNATSTHDSKRSEDVRCRLAALSEIPDAWESALRELSRLACTGNDDSVRPDAADQRYVFETLVGAWPLDGNPDADFLARITTHLTKAAREAKRHSSWLDPDEAYESALQNLAERVVDGHPAGLRRTVQRIVTEIECAGGTNSLAAAVLKATAPGVPDVYQGCDRWAFNLVDPDNRRPVDWAAHRASLAGLPELSDDADHSAEVAELLAGWRDGRVKQHVVRQSLLARRSLPRLFGDGRYLPLDVAGDYGSSVVAFARRRRDQWAVTIVPRLTRPLTRPGEFPIGDRWGNTAVKLPAGAPSRFRNRLTGREVGVTRGRWALADVLPDLPVAVLVNG